MCNYVWPSTVRSDEWPAWFSFWFSGCWRALAKGMAWAGFYCVILLLCAITCAIHNHRPLQLPLLAMDRAVGVLARMDGFAVLEGLGKEGGRGLFELAPDPWRARGWLLHRVAARTGAVGVAFAEGRVGEVHVDRRWPMDASAVVFFRPRLREAPPVVVVLVEIAVLHLPGGRMGNAGQRERSDVAQDTERAATAAWSTGGLGGAERGVRLGALQLPRVVNMPTGRDFVLSHFASRRGPRPLDPSLTVARSP